MSMGVRVRGAVGASLTTHPLTHTPPTHPRCLRAACPATPITSGGLRSAVAALTWNTATAEVVAAGGAGPAGTVSVFRQRVPGR